MPHRAAPEEAVVLVGTLGMIALAPGTGALLWQLPPADHGIQSRGYTRVARLGELIVFSNGSHVAFIDASPHFACSQGEIATRGPFPRPFPRLGLTIAFIALKALRRRGSVSRRRGRWVARDANVLGLVAYRACAPGSRTQTPAAQAVERGDGLLAAEVRPNRRGEIPRVARANLNGVARVRQPAEQGSAYVSLGRRRGTRPAPERWHPAQPTPPSGRGTESLRGSGLQRDEGNGKRLGGRVATQSLSDGPRERTTGGVRRNTLHLRHCEAIGPILRQRFATLLPRRGEGPGKGATRREFIWN